MRKIGFTDAPDILGFIACLALIILGFYLLLRKQPFNRYRSNRIKSKNILKKINAFPFEEQRMAYLRKIDPFVFEELLLDAFESKGFKVIRNKRYTGDQGIDGVVWKAGQKYLIQAKRYKGHIKLKHITEFSDLVETHDCQGLFCHTGKTGLGSKTASKVNGKIIIISGSTLLDLISQKSLSH
ncbi:restriction endonuclease [Sphingobacterium siyangense]|uniref:restriction endonuclease n=1 Tax=Sphingobacterium siyangense TaxID=459529 RepID=UPI00289A5CC8|nr:restriction endonuclease [Sphingobacterium siyangense]